MINSYITIPQTTLNHGYGPPLTGAIAGFVISGSRGKNWLYGAVSGALVATIADIAITYLQAKAKNTIQTNCLDFKIDVVDSLIEDVVLVASAITLFAMGILNFTLLFAACSFAAGKGSYDVWSNGGIMRDD
jgi:hypothetical protein